MLRSMSPSKVINKSRVTFCVTQQSYKHFMQEKFKDTKEVIIRSGKSQNDKSEETR